VLNIILGIVVTAILVVVLAFCIIQLRRRRRRRKHETVTVHFVAGSTIDNPPTTNHAQSTISTANGRHQFFTEQTEKISIL